MPASPERLEPARGVNSDGERLGVQTRSTEPGSSWEIGCNSRFSGALRDELIDGGVVYATEEAVVLIGRWRTEYNCARPHRA